MEKPTYEMLACREFSRVLCRSRNDRGGHPAGYRRGRGGVALRPVFADPLAKQVRVHAGLECQARQRYAWLKAGLDQRLPGLLVVVVPLAITARADGLKLRDIGSLCHEVSTCC